MLLIYHNLADFFLNYWFSSKRHKSDFIILFFFPANCLHYFSRKYVLIRWHILGSKNNWLFNCYILLIILSKCSTTCQFFLTSFNVMHCPPFWCKPHWYISRCNSSKLSSILWRQSWGFHMLLFAAFITISGLQ